MTKIFKKRKRRFIYGPEQGLQRWLAGSALRVVDACCRSTFKFKLGKTVAEMFPFTC